MTESIQELACATTTGTVPIELTTLDDWCDENAVERVDVMKLDIQGGELDALRGATRILRSVRAREVEVEFNPIYEGQPLFGDVDAFLRSRGFVLWRLGSLTHYTDRPGRGPSPAADVFHYDSRPLPVAAMGGQLIWGHAYYVRPETAAGGAGLDRATRSRDAILLRVLGFHDLAGRLAEVGPAGPSRASGSTA